ncbi:MAG TPA: zinc-binding dehydrogenase [Thermoanaerobaculia bacterium]|jgi:propanol-preferring alcohol dehydrogenase|nr:zinc-binding dehydrogenase [Thermoanaerobaculia bacterium]
MHAVRLTALQSPLIDDEIDDVIAGPGETVVDIRAAGICHSDAHYRAGGGTVALPLTLGHEIAGVIAGTDRRVALHYLHDDGRMLGKEVDGGYAERIVVPTANLVPIPEGVPFDAAAVMMCSTATAYHALRLASLRAGESVAIIGFGGLGASAAQLAKVMGADKVFAVDRVPDKLDLARSFGAIPTAVEELRDIDIALDFAGHPPTTLGALRSLRRGGRIMIVAINLRELAIDPYRDVLANERHIIGVSDHTRDELVELLAMAAHGQLDMSRVITRRVPMDAAAINAVLDDLDAGTTHLRTVIERRD